MSGSNRILLHGSQERQPFGARRLSQKPSANEIIQATVVIPPASGNEVRLASIRELASQLPASRKHLDAGKFLKVHGARREDMKAVERYAKENGLHVVESSRIKRSVVLSGSIGAFAQAFLVQFTNSEFLGETYRSFENGVHIPVSLQGSVQAILGLENRSLMSHHAFMHASANTHHVEPAEVAKAYSFPETATGKGQRISIIELGGGFYMDDIETYFRKQGAKKRKITVIEIDGQRNDPSPKDTIKKMLDAMGVSTSKETSSLDRDEAIKALWTIETTFDIELAGSFAPDAEIVVYFAPNNAQGKYHALTSALHNPDYPPTVLSCSWGAVEDDLTPDFVDALDQVFQDAALRGITVCFSSGDRGDDCDKSGQPRVHFPASSPHVVSCGGTHWVEPQSAKDEIVWTESLPTAVAQSGGGVSKVFPQPDWQSAAEIEKKTQRNGRGVPDVSGKADMAAGYGMIVGGYDVTMGGTSAAAPMWTGLFARLNEELQHNIGYATPLFYRTDFCDAFHDILEGNNGKYYRAEPGWDACTGLGTPHGTKLLAALRRKSS